MQKIITSVAVLIVEKGKVLLVKHRKDAAHEFGTYGFPSGTLHKGELEKDAAVRELQEETGLKTTAGLLFEFPNNFYTADIKRKDGSTNRFSMRVFISNKDYVGELKNSPETIPQWVKISELDNYNLLPNVKNAIETALKFLKMSKPKISLIAAISENRALGKDNQLIFKIPEDMKRFKEITSGHPIIMGRKTHESIGRPLPNRKNIVVTRDKSFKVEGCEVENSIEDAIKAAEKVDKSEIYIIGGGQIYEQAMKFADKFYLTLVEGEYDADTFFPNYSEFNKVINEESHESAGYKYKFLELEK